MQADPVCSSVSTRIPPRPSGRATSTSSATPARPFNGFLADLHIWGAPEQVTTNLLDYVARTDAGGVLVTLSYGGTPYDQANANFDLYAREVLPALQAHDVGGDISVTYASNDVLGDAISVGLVPG
jgi:hypothetical protein